MAATVATPLERQLGRIAGVNEITSTSSQGSTRVTLQFDLGRDIDSAANDVQAAINAARSQLPTSLPNNPTYRKVNPADTPIMVMALTSDTFTPGEMYDVASTVLAQKLSQVEGIGQVSVGGSSLPAVRVELNPTALNHHGIGLDEVRAALSAANANRPKGLRGGQDDQQWWIYANDQAKTAAEYRPLVVAYRNGAPVRLADVAEVVDSVQDVRNAGSANGKPAVILQIYREPGANIIETVERVRSLLPYLRASIPAAIDLDLMMERTSTIRASLHDVERTLAIAIALVVMVVFLFLRSVRATLIPSVAVPVSLIATFSVMYLAGFSLNNLSLMALIVAAGFVVDDAIVVLENVFAAHRGWHAAAAGGTRRRARSRLHGAFDERVAGCRVHPVALDGRHRRPPVPGICGNAVGRGAGLARGIAHRHPDDVRAAAQAQGRANVAARCTVRANAFSAGCCAATKRASPGRCAMGAS